MIKLNRFFVRGRGSALFILSLILIAGWDTDISRPAKKPVVIGYVAGFRGLIRPETIDAQKLTHINYAFVNIRDNKAVLEIPATDTVNFRILNGLKKINPDLKLLISIGGWTWSGNFSDMALTDESRRLFAASAVELLRRYQLDGIDIDWEYPNQRGDNNVFRPVDKQNYTLLFQALREDLNREQSASGKTYLLTTAVGGFPAFIENTEMDKAHTYLDYINIMSYDYSWDKVSHHTNLYASGPDNKENSADRAVRDYQRAGVPAEKLVMGLAFYGRGKKYKAGSERIIGSASVATARAGGFGFMKDSLIGKNGYTTHWDSAAQAPYLLNRDSLIFISYDDERSVDLKCRYVLSHKLAGVMFWEYSNDEQGYLLNQINRSFRFFTF